MSAEYLAKAYFSKQGFRIITPDSHESVYDFLIESTGLQKVQVKATLDIGDLVRIRNKHGSTNKPYTISDYDILAGVWVDRNRIYLFNSDAINGGQYGEAITVDTQSGRTLSNHDRPTPYFAGPI